MELTRHKVKANKIGPVFCSVDRYYTENIFVLYQAKMQQHTTLVSPSDDASSFNHGPVNIINNITEMKLMIYQIRMLTWGPSLSWRLQSPGLPRGVRLSRGRQSGLIGGKEGIQGGPVQISPATAPCPEFLSRPAPSPWRLAFAQVPQTCVTPTLAAVKKNIGSTDRSHDPAESRSSNTCRSWSQRFRKMIWTNKLCKFFWGQISVYRLVRCSAYIFN